MKLLNDRHYQNQKILGIENCRKTIVEKNVPTKFRAKESLKRKSIRNEDILAPNSLEIESLEIEVGLHDACGFDSRPQYILRHGPVIDLTDPFEGVQEAETENSELDWLINISIHLHQIYVHSLRGQSDWFIDTSIHLY